ncbi:MAG: HAMP domain-containing sensor histidine kinase [Eubacteriales bacterium]|nr:HAMP domain-containing sensor histidine kinase [Eubacteriales bacterium]
MFYFAFIFVFLSAFVLISGKRDISIKYFILVMLSYVTALFFMMTYLAKDTWFDNVMVDYFSMPLAVWKFLMFLPVNKQLILCLWNLSCLSVLYFSICFAMSFIMYGKKTEHILLKRVIAIILAIEYIVYHPIASKYIYYSLYPSLMTSEQIECVKIVFHKITWITNAAIIFGSILMLVCACRKVTPLRVIRYNMFFIVFSYILIMGSYLFVLGFYPAFFIKVSKFSDTVSFLSVSISDSLWMQTVFPYYLSIMFILLCISLYKFSRTMQKMRQQSVSLSKQIAASDTTSKVFCHYMKNELLAVQSELEELELQDQKNEVLSNAIRRCKNLYDRLDKIHTSTKASELYMTKENLNEFLKDMLETMSYDFKELRVTVRSEREDIYVLLDTNYFGQALHNILTNAVDSMKETEKKNLDITVKVINNWAAIFIKDSGTGIEKENLDKIFTPFFTSHSVAKHWGIGLTLTHKIITVHEGYIEVESKINEGTVVKIMLPLLMG